MTSNVEVLVVGAGAIGAFYASRLARAAYTNVSVICRSNYEAVKTNGFSVTSPVFGNYKFNPLRTYSSAEHARKEKRLWDFVLVSTKALPDIRDDSEVLEGLVSNSTSIVLVQNGLGVEAPYSKRFPKTSILSAVVAANVGQTSPGNISHYKWTQFSVGPWLPGEGQSPLESSSRAKTEQLTKLFQEGGIEDAKAYDHTDLQFMRWHKVAINAAMNPSAVLTSGSDNASLANDSDVRAHLKGVMEEVYAAAPKVLGRPFPKGFPSADQILKSISSSPKGSKVSMLLDWEESKPMEIEVILANPVRLAREHGVEMPRLQSLYALTKMAQANRDRQRDQGIQPKL